MEASLSLYVRRGSQGSCEAEERIWTRWRRMGERSGRSAVGGEGDIDAVGTDARSGEKRVSRFEGKRVVGCCGMLCRRSDQVVVGCLLSHANSRT